MREILFRGKRLGSGEWVEGDRISSDGREFIVGMFGVCSIDTDRSPDKLLTVRAFEVNPDTLCRHTGLYDRYDKAIYEDDIVESRDFDEEEGYGRVEWDKESARFVVKGNYLTKDFYNICGWELTILGNMHDNAALWEAYHDG